MRKLKTKKDAQLVAEYCRGDKTAMVLLVKRWHTKFCERAYYYTRDFDVAKDLAQDTWIAIMKHIATIETPEKFGRWGLSIVTRKSIDWYRKNKKMFEQLQKIQSESNALTQEDMSQEGDDNVLEEIKAAIALLSIEQQAVLKMFYIESNTIHEISKILNLSKGTVKSRLFYAREKLKETFKK